MTYAVVGGDARLQILARLLAEDNTVLDCTEKLYESYAALRKTHKMYREKREVTTTPERRAEIDSQMIEIASKTPVPKNSEYILTYLLKK